MELYNRRLLLVNGDDHEPYSMAAYAPLLRSPLKLPAPSDLDPDVAYTILILLAALLFLAFISLYIRRFADAAGRHRSPSCGGGLDPITIQSLPVFAYRGESKDHVDCAICLTEFHHGEALKIIPNCSHAFHPDCVDAWLVSHVTCPICRGTTFLTLHKLEQSADQGVINHPGQPTLDNNGEGRVSFTSHSQRRSTSCSSFRDKLVLPRTLSY